MTYGMRERLSGAVILAALAVIFLPMLFDDPVPREERPQPMLSIEAPLEVERVAVEAPQPPTRLDEAPARAPNETKVTSGNADREPAPPSEEQAVASSEPASSSQPPASQEQADADESAQAASQADPIAELARAAEAKRAAAGEWSVQAGSFGEPGNAERLEQQLEAKGFNAYRRPRGNDLTAVYVGPYANAEEGERARSELKAKANLQGLVVRMSP